MRVWMWTMEPGADPAAEEDILAACVDDAVRARAAARPPGARWPFLAAHAVCRLQLAAAFGTPPRDWRFAVTPEGRPLLAAPPPGTPGDGFSLSHTSGCAGCALVLDAAGPDTAIGFDVETPRPGRPLLALARRFLHPDEAAQVARADTPDPTFTRLWTFKEAVTKALGRGFQESFQSFRTQPAPPHLISAPPHFGPLRTWHLSAGEIGPALWALAVRADAAPAVVRKHFRAADIHLVYGKYHRMAD